MASWVVHIQENMRTLRSWTSLWRSSTRRRCAVQYTFCSDLHQHMDPLLGCRFLLDCSTSSCIRPACMSVELSCALHLRGTQPRHTQAYGADTSFLVVNMHANGANMHSSTIIMHIKWHSASTNMHACKWPQCRVVQHLGCMQGYDVKIHVDAASGGFVAPFVEPDLKWDFRLKNVCSINTSGHK